MVGMSEAVKIGNSQHCTPTPSSESPQWVQPLAIGCHGLHPSLLSWDSGPHCWQRCLCSYSCHAATAHGQQHLHGPCCFASAASKWRIWGAALRSNAHVLAAKEAGQANVRHQLAVWFLQKRKGSQSYGKKEKRKKSVSYSPQIYLTKLTNTLFSLLKLPKKSTLLNTI